MSIVCATDFSDTARRASDIAAQLAHKKGEPLWLVHVLNANSMRAFGQALLSAAEQALSDEAKRLAKWGGQVRHSLLMGDPAGAVDTFAREEEATLVMTAAPPPEARFLGVGGTVDRLVQALEVPLLVVREPAAMEAWVRGERPLKVMVGVDRSLPFETAREWVHGLLKYGPVELVGGRVYWPDEEYQRLGLERPVGFGEVTPELQHSLEKETATLMAPLAEGGKPPRIRLEAGVGRIADHLVELAEQERADLLVVGTHQRRALGKLWSVSHHVLRLARISVVCVPARAVGGAELPVPSFREVLVATDFSPTGNRAVSHAFGMTPEGGTVHLVHVTEGARTPEQDAELRRQLMALVPKSAEAAGRQVRVEVLHGSKDVVTTLVQASERLAVDAIVMGTHGRSGLKLAVLGSVTQALLLRTDRPVLVVRPPQA
ncbi:universal stress protein [Pyxidicoccus xibeiensis]|uniref:universal stress protein n=1 Tax=Pyxidicoccus xibeiensis TaxID=2906759 RepID=UPI0020A7D5FE|nr:universal stress protein [Pyxidicoccus xibeiensis]MCP3143898.1 universal stress protein [Pyxidicoccus xibeiensis]